MIHPDLLLQIAEQRARDLRTAAHRHRLQRYAASFRTRRTIADRTRSITVPTIARRRDVPVMAAPSTPTTSTDGTCCCAA